MSTDDGHKKAAGQEVDDRLAGSARANVDREVAAYMAKERGGRTVLRVVVPILVLLLVGGGGWLAVSLIELKDYGEYKDKIETLQKELRIKRCQKKKTVDLCETLIAAKDPEAALKAAAKYFKKCGEHRRLRWATLEANKRLKRWPAAIKEATVLIDAVPHEWDYRWWRAQLHEQAGSLELAIADYRQTILLNPRLTRIPFNLADALEKAGRPCEALFWLRSYLNHHRKPGSAPHVRERHSRLLALAECQALRGKGQGRIAFDADTRTFEASAKGRASQKKGRFLLHPKGPLVMLSSKLAKEVGVVPLAHGPQSADVLVRARSGGLYKKVRLGLLAELRIGKAEARQILVGVTSQLPEGIDGVMGWSFFSRFERVRVKSWDAAGATEGWSFLPSISQTSELRIDADSASSR
jgi:tetratricopeptide (TPR) repeat protein